MSAYKVKTGWNQTLGSLNTLIPAPDEQHPGGIQYTRVTRMTDGSLVKEGPFFPFPWEQLEETDYAAILALFGVAAADSANVTILVRDVDLVTWVRMNGVAQRPIPGDTVTWDIRPQDITIMVTDLVVSS
jgi:hypothetical protein